MPHPRAGEFVRLDDVTEIRLDDAIERAKSCPAWPEWCERAPELAEWCGLTGLSKEEAGKWLLSMGSLRELWQREWERTHKISVLKGSDYMNEIWNELKKREPLRDEILEYVKGALDSKVAAPQPAPDAVIAGHGPGPARRKSSPVRERAEAALRSLYGDGVPDQATVPNGILCRRVHEWLKNNKMGRVGDTTILRAAERHK
jgi:hypothetical protein